MRSSHFLFHLTFFFLTYSNAQRIDLSTLLPADYDNRIRPKSLDNETFTVGLSVYVNGLLGVNDAAQQFSLDMTLIQEWFDPRLNLSALEHRENLNLVLSSDISRFWLPDLYFMNSRTAKPISSLQTQQKLIVFRSGVVQYRVRLSSSFNCHMWLLNYPHDWHVCSFDVTSLRYFPGEMHIRWMDFDVNDRIEYPQQKIRSWWIDRCDNQTDRFDLIRANSCVRGSIKLVRRLSYYVIRYYLLSFLMVAVAFVGFWLPVNAWPARANIVVAPLFSLITIDIAMNNEVGVNYTVSLHMWMMFLQAFLYCCLIEWTLAAAWAHMINAKKRYALVVAQSKTGQMTTVVQVPEHLDGYYCGSSGWFRKVGKWIDVVLKAVYGHVPFKTDPMTRNKVDYVARLFFPFLLVFFTFMYVMLTTVRWSAHFH